MPRIDPRAVAYWLAVDAGVLVLMAVVFAAGVLIGVTVVLLARGG